MNIEEDKQAVKQQKQSIQTLVFPQHPQWREALYNDKHFGTILRALRGEVEAKDQKELKKTLTNFELIDNILCLRQNGLYRAVVPFQFRRQLLTVYHNDKKAGHKGYDQTLLLVSKTYWWPGLTQDVKNFVQACIWYPQTRQRPDGWMGS